jgi:hypothetical protein
MINEGADYVGILWCDLVDMLRYDARVIVYSLVKRNAKVLLFRMTTLNIDVWGPQGQGGLGTRGLGTRNGLPLRRDAFTCPDTT